MGAVRNKARNNQRKNCWAPLALSALASLGVWPAAHAQKPIAPTPTIQQPQPQESIKEQTLQIIQLLRSTNGLLRHGQMLTIEGAAPGVPEIPTAAGAPIRGAPYENESALKKDWEEWARAGVVKKGDKGRKAQALAGAMAGAGLFDPQREGFSGAVNDALEAAVKRAQAAYGLEEDGLAGQSLLWNLRLTQDERRERAGKARDAWLDFERKAKEMGAKKYIIVDVSAFMLVAGDIGADGKSREALRSRVIVGRPGRQTPFDEINVVGLKYHPDWTPPPTIVARDLIPSAQKGGGWLRSHGVRVYDKETGEEIVREDLDAQAAESGAYRFHQPPGDDNALGILKFETDSKKNIYLHDTNARNYFKRQYRALSSGCVRVQDWRRLALWVSGKTDQEFSEKMATRKTRIEKMEKIPVFIYAGPAFFRENGQPAFYPNPYSGR